MNKDTVYFDWAATALPLDEAINEQFEITRHYWGNPSSLHTIGEKARNKLNEIRITTAKMLGAAEKQIYFTSGASESNSIVLGSLLQKPQKGHIAISSIEHPSVWETAGMLKKQGWELSIIKADKRGQITSEALENALQPNTHMVAVMHVNNETGAIQNIPELVQTVRDLSKGKRPIHFHCDAVQGFGKFPIDLKSWDVDSAAFSGHKIGASRGAGILYLKDQKILPLFTGGGQENGIRPGTENLAAIASLVPAMQNPADIRYGKELYALIKAQAAQIKGLKILPESRSENEELFSPWVISLSAPPIPGEVLARILAEDGFAVSTGSACSSRKKRDTRVLEAMKIDDKTAFSSFRISTGPATTTKDIQAFFDCLKEHLPILLDTAL